MFRVRFSPTTVRGLLLALAVIVLDQASKWWIVNIVMTPPQSIEIMPFFNLVLAWNRGISFSMLQYETDVMPYVLSMVALGVVLVLVRWLQHAARGWTILGLGLVIGGALGNVVDRLRFGAVVDFLDFHAAGVHFPAFNLADSAISLGVVVLLIDGLFDDAGKA